jgi:hypothetical protein
MGFPAVWADADEGAKAAMAKAHAMAAMSESFAR